jgi:hypothetical protein
VVRRFATAAQESRAQIRCVAVYNDRAEFLDEGD